MSYELTQIVLRYKLDIPPLDKLVLATLADKIDHKGFCFPSVKGLCKLTKMSKNAVINALKRLEAIKLLRVEKQLGYVNKYRFEVENLKSRIIELNSESSEGALSLASVLDTTLPSKGLPDVPLGDTPSPSKGLDPSLSGTLVNKLVNNSVNKGSKAVEAAKEIVQMLHSLNPVIVSKLLQTGQKIVADYHEADIILYGSADNGIVAATLISEFEPSKFVVKGMQTHDSDFLIWILSLFPHTVEHKIYIHLSHEAATDIEMYYHKCEKSGIPKLVDVIINNKVGGPPMHMMVEDQNLPEIIENAKNIWLGDNKIADDAMPVLSCFGYINFTDEKFKTSVSDACGFEGVKFAEVVEITPTEAKHLQKFIFGSPGGSTPEEIIDEAVENGAAEFAEEIDKDALSGHVFSPQGFSMAVKKGVSEMIDQLGNDTLEYPETLIEHKSHVHIDAPPDADVQMFDVGPITDGQFKNGDMVSMLTANEVVIGEIVTIDAKGGKIWVIPQEKPEMKVADLKEATKSNNLGLKSTDTPMKIWATAVGEWHEKTGTDPTFKVYTQKHKGMLNQLAKKVPDYNALIFTCVVNWKKFVAFTCEFDGTKLTPKQPTMGYLIAHVNAALAFTQKFDINITKKQKPKIKITKKTLAKGKTKALLDAASGDKK